VRWRRSGGGSTGEGVSRSYGENREWTKHKIYELLRTMGSQGASIDSTAIYDKRTAYRIAYELRARAGPLSRHRGRAEPGGTCAHKTRRGTPLVQCTKDLMRSAVYHDRSTPRGLALYLKERPQLARNRLRLAQAGHFPKRGGQWYPQTVKLLFVS
jgi:hypothetical protein